LLTRQTGYNIDQAIIIEINKGAGSDVGAMEAMPSDTR
jgi:hypothetical protein